ncbi:hypothetical protein BTUL_0036g00440 [Botrytis tulipae]|uniref:Uncharacterized protein n=1 Tax=Botrytis tulipae TaxID=87230 RepID=A0A4Z1EZ92_9HELO|nr:hypothetical protein BTUL_0036g00440 [Botrytis tulipae]
MEIDKARWLVSQSGQQKVLSMIGWLSEKQKIDATNGNNREWLEDGVLVWYHEPWNRNNPKAKA